MLRPPTKGFGVSVTKHNVDLNTFVEWLEGCVTFVDETVSQSDVVDILIEDDIYRESDFAMERISDVWLELERRSQVLRGAGTYTVRASRVESVRRWREVPAYSFCLMTALQVPYRDVFVDVFGHDYTQQGLLLERLTAEAMEAIGWRAHATGWSKTSSASIVDKVAELAAHLGERDRPDSIPEWTDEKAKDAGLDVVCHLPFVDRWSGRPLLYVQCASGENWKDKRASPNLDLWDKLLDLATRPRRGIAVPFAFLADDFRQAANYDALSLLLDRHRLSAPPTSTDVWLSEALASDLIEWVDGRLPALLKASAD